MDEKQAIALLKKHSTDENAFKAVLAHSRTVQKKALETAEAIKRRNTDIKIDTDFIKTACILHDIGRFKYPPGRDSIKHGLAGAELLRREGLNEEYARVCERHLGAGIPKEDVEKRNLPIPPKDYIPETIEEKIIAYADNLSSQNSICTSKDAVERFTKEIGSEAGERVKKLHNEIESLMTENKTKDQKTNEKAG